MPVFTHQRTASETRSLMIIADLPTVWLNGCLKSIFNTHMIYIDLSGVCFRLNAPVGTHFLYGRVCDAGVIDTFFIWKSAIFFHEASPKCEFGDITINPSCINMTMPCDIAIMWDHQQRSHRFYNIHLSVGLTITCYLNRTSRDVKILHKRCELAPYL